VSCGADSLARLTVVDDLAEALATTTCSVGFTRRSGAARALQPSLRSLLAEQSEALPRHVIDSRSNGPPTALVFGCARVSPLCRAAARCGSWAARM